MNTAIDVDARRDLAEAARHLATGRITNRDFESRLPTSSERELHEIIFYGLWPLYDDFLTHRLTGRRALTTEGRAFVARIILFLRSGEPYRFPRSTGLGQIPVLLLSILSFGWFGRFWRRYRWRYGDQETWPFFSRGDYDRALRHPVYFRTRKDA